MLSLATETKLDIFKIFTHQQLCSIKQTNFYFNDFITNFEGELAREELYKISIGDFKNFKLLRHELIKPDAKHFDFLLNEQFEEKFKNGLEMPIPLYLHAEDSSKNVVICLIEALSKKLLILQLPDIIKSKDDIRIVYYYLNKLFNCSFKYGTFNKASSIFNPKLLQLLFGNAKQVYIRRFVKHLTDRNIEDVLKFILNHLISNNLEIVFYSSEEDIAKYKDILFKILTKGDNFNEINLINLLNSTTLYENIIEYIATSRNCSQMVSSILFDFNNHTNLKLNKKAEDAEIKQYDESDKSTKYQITNIFNPKVRFSFYSEEWKRFWDFGVMIRIKRV
ncbi:unnamed protein product [Meloidogyne enterolobii]|uniref:Uncharacterized protein n=1 Tax=Meloidogyne enterolobii TaxID=390850 RepID=A0ACB0ZK74_MELEN